MKTLKPLIFILKATLDFFFMLASFLARVSFSTLSFFFSSFFLALRGLPHLLGSLAVFWKVDLW